jgi:sugar transferase (PEP-CTERM/EpsH1 system associated)
MDGRTGFRSYRMKILWAKTDFLHPTNRGGQIRTLEMLKRLSRRNEVHYVAYDDPNLPEGRERAAEYSAMTFPVNRPIAPRSSPRFFAQLAANLFSPLPLAVARYRSALMTRQLATLIAGEHYDAVVADFLSITPNFEDLSKCTLFQHNVESIIWRRHAEHARSPQRRVYFQSQARRMANYEREVCRTVRCVVSVSPSDTQTMQREFGAQRIEDVPTGVDIEYFRRLEHAPATSDLVFVGAMDWLPNIDGALWFMQEVLPIIRSARPKTTITFAGRNPSPEIRALADQARGIRVTGTVPDVRPYLWGASVSIVPLRIGGGTRLKIYEAMAAGVPVISTTVGAEGLAVTDGCNIHLADDAETFARKLLALLSNATERQTVADAAINLVTETFSWESVTERFEAILAESGDAATQAVRAR